ncbi:HAD-IA family hydrolase [Streptomyces sp. NPDC092296]|uniref:HAD-IA family hydrolase n=1 Tax=Streptomyces sp. NPDC092296 TaxID=3366012 RepID=UPI00382A9699
MAGRTSLAPYRGLLLDFAGVLTEEVLGVHRTWCVEQGLEPHAWRSTLNDHQEGRVLYADLEVGRISQAEWNERTGPLLGVSDSVNLMGRAWAGVRASVAMIGLARAARSAGLVVGLLSNSFGLDPYDPYREMGVWDLFDVHVVSELEGVAKPDPAIYELALHRMGLAAGEVVFVDDHERNLPPAEELGMTAILGDGSRQTAQRVAGLLQLEIVAV